MKKIQITLLLSFILSFGNAQNSNMHWGETFGEQIFGIGQAKLFAADETGYYVQAGQKAKNTLYKFDFDNKLIFEKPLLIEEEDKSYRFTSFAQTNKGLYGIASHLGQYGNKKKVFVGKITDNGIENFRHFKTYDYKNPINDNVVDNKDLTEQVKVSKDGSKAVHFDIASTSDYKGGNEKFTIHLLNETLDLLWEKKVELPINDKSALIEDVFVTNDETVWVSIKMFDAKTRKYHIPYRYNLIKITKDKRETYELDLREDLLIASMKVDFDEMNDAAFISGTFTNLDNRRYIEGVFSGYFDETEGTISYASVHVFSEEEVLKTAVRRMWSKKQDFDENADYYKVREIVKLPNGGYKTLVEYSKLATVSRGNNMGTEKYYKLRNFILFNTLNNEVSDVTFVERTTDSYEDYDYYFKLEGAKSYLFYSHFPTKEERKGLKNTPLGAKLSYLKIFDAENNITSIETLWNTGQTKHSFTGVRYVAFGEKIIWGGIYAKIQSFMPGFVKRNYKFGVYTLK
jgi:hypothetical protein